MIMKPLRILILAVLSAAIAGCKNKSQPVVGVAEKPDSAFVRLSEKYLDEYLAWRPGAGTYLGLHQYDRYVRNYHKASLDAEIARLKSYEAKLIDFPKDSLSDLLKQDHAILLASIRQELFSFREMSVFTKNPMTYAGVFGLNIFIQRDFAPLEERVRSIIATEDQAADVFAAARENLQDSLAKPFVETAIEIASGTASFLGKELAEAVNASKDESLKKTFAASNARTIEELNNYVAWLKKEKLPKDKNTA